MPTITLEVSDSLAKQLRESGVLNNPEQLAEKLHLSANALAVLEDYLGVFRDDAMELLAPIKGYIDLLDKEVGGELSPMQRDFITIINNNIMQLQRLTKDLLDMARMELTGANTNPLAAEHLDFRAVVAEAIAVLQPSITIKQQTLKNDLPDDLPKVRGAKDHLLKLMVELLRNANKFTPNAGSITIVATAMPDELFVTIKDSGVGIQPDEVERVFDKHFRGSNAAATSGNGLGLTIARYIVQGHGGQLWLESEVDKGTAVHLKLPIVKE